MEENYKKDIFIHIYFVYSFIGFIRSLLKFK